MKDLDEGAFSSLGDLIGGEVVYRARDVMKDATHFKVVSTISDYIIFKFFFLWCIVVPIAYELISFLLKWAFPKSIWKGIASVDNIGVGF